MTIDERIIGRICIFDVSNADEALAYVGEDCYMTDCFSLFEDLDNISIYRLDAVDKGFYNNEKDHFFEFCLPVRFLKPIEKKFRPFKDSEEFIRVVGDVGDHIQYRLKDDSEIIRALITEVIKNSKYVMLGCSVRSFDLLFNKFEYCKSGVWVPFGVEE